jgi:hypothetical protein
MVIPLFISCGMFDTRDPAAPSESGVPWRQPTQARYVVDNLKNTIEGMDLGLYTKCAEIDSFMFYADPALVETDPAKYENWIWQVEENVTRSLFQTIELYWADRDSAVVITLDEEEWLISETDSAQVQYEYQVIFHHGRAAIDSTGEGSLRWKFRRNPVDRLWYLVEWRDFADDDHGGWSAIKGYFRS